MSQPWLSVLIPTYNGEKYLSAALDSILAQNDNGIECVAVDDGSSDATLSILEEYQKCLQLTLLQRQRRGNWVANTNHALSHAAGKYICFLHQDDRWHKNRLVTMKRLIDQFPSIDLFLHDSNFIDDKGKTLGLWRCPLPPYPKTIAPGAMTGRLLIQNFISIPAPIFNREKVLKVGGLDESLWYTADWDLWLKLSLEVHVLYYPQALSDFRVHLNSQTISRSSTLQDFKGQLENVFQKYFTQWDVPANLKNQTQKAALFSIEVNTALAGTIHQKRTGLINLWIDFLRLGPVLWHSYLVNSRIWERTTARLKAQLTKFTEEK